MKKALEMLVLGVLVAGIGAGGGWYAAHQGSRTVAMNDGSDDPAHAARAIQLPPETLANLGVTIGKAEAVTFTRYRAIPAVIAQIPTSVQPVYAPIGGRVRSVPEPGTVVAAGSTLVTLVRDPIPRPKLVLTEEILKPGKETVHDKVFEVRRTKEEIGIVQAELDRIKKFTGQGSDPVIPRQTAIDLSYRLRRARRAHERARLELEKHGFTEEQMTAMEGGGPIPNLGRLSWKRALEHNGLWPVEADRLLAALPEPMRGERWVIATIGELAGAGLAGDALDDFLKATPRSCSHFLEIGSLLQRGYSVADVRNLHDLGALEPVVEIKALPASVAPDWDVVAVKVKPGAHVEVGAELVDLVDAREMYLRLEPVGAEGADLLRVMTEGARCVARPLVKGSGPILDEIKIAFVTSSGAGEGTAGFARVKNTAFAVGPEESPRRHRSWRLRSGLRYVLRIPVQQMKNVLVLPREAVTYNGADRVVFIPDGDAFKPLPVTVAFEDDEVVVVPLGGGSKIFPGDQLVQSGAYALGLALRGSGSGGGGHGHPHPH